MKKQKRPSAANAGNAATPAEAQDDAMAQNLVELALDLTELDEYDSVPDELKKKKSEFQKIIRKCLQQKRDLALGEALERTYEEDATAFELLKEALEEASQTIVFRREDGPDFEVDAFVIPLFVRTTGGLHAEQCFQDEEAFDALRDSFQDGKLESPDGRVVLVSYAYHPDEIERIGHGQLSEMVREAFESMTRKKLGAAPEIARSMSGWPEQHFAADDNAVELRFLLGFALKAVDDPFYRVPENEAAADRYFDMRAEHFRRWSRQVAPLVKRCLVTDGLEVEIDFLYQDLFHGGKATGIAEYYMLQMMSELQQALQTRGLAPEEANAVIGPTEVADGMVVRVNLYAGPDGALVASFDKPIAIMRELQAEADDVYDALTTIGVKSLALAMKFDADGRPVNPRPYALQ